MSTAPAPVSPPLSEASPPAPPPTSATPARVVAHAPTSAPPPPERGPWLAALWHAFVVFAVVRVGLFFVGMLGTGLMPPAGGIIIPGRNPQPLRGGWQNGFTGWERWDALWFLRIAEDGYYVDDVSAAFFPLYPMVTRTVGQLLGDRWLLAGTLVSNVALVVALVLLHRLTELEFDRRTARRTVLYLCVFPTAFFLIAPYTESLFLALAVGCLYAARRGHWVLAGALGLSATTTRSTGVVLALALAVEGVLQFRASDRPARWRLQRLALAGAAAGVVPLGVVGYLAWWEATTGDWRRPFDLQRTAWSKEGLWPWETIGLGIRSATTEVGLVTGDYVMYELLVVLPVLAAVAWGIYRLRATYSAFALGSAILPLTLNLREHPLQSVPRYYLVVFPAYWAFVAFGDRFKAHTAVLAISAAAMGLTSLLFVGWFRIY